LQLPGAPGYHWYSVPRVGHPHPPTIQPAYPDHSRLQDQRRERTALDPEQTILGGFSMGTVMSYAMGLGPDRPSPLGILAFSGFIPIVEGWSPDLTRSGQTRVFITHGRWDPVIGVAFAQSARDLLASAGFSVDYGESDADHSIPPDELRRAVSWLARTVDE
ncbi:MAG: alpha/beta hydrolase, partial [Candidatus Woesearchaeota archaeon]